MHMIIVIDNGIPANKETLTENLYVFYVGPTPEIYRPILTYMINISCLMWCIVTMRHIKQCMFVCSFSAICNTRTMDLVNDVDLLLILANVPRSHTSGHRDQHNLNYRVLTVRIRESTRLVNHAIT